MSEHTVEQLFDAFARAYLRGESPDVSEYLVRAGGERDELGDLIDRFLQAVPAQPPTEEEVVLMQARLDQEPPLLVLRHRRALKREAVVSALVSALGLDPAKRDKVADYYHRLEVGTLDPKPVSSRVWDALGEFFHANVRVLAGLRPPLVVEQGAYLREAQYLASWDAAPDRDDALRSTARRRMISGPRRVPAREGRDEIDRLFTASH